MATCTLEARLKGRDPVVVKEQAGTAHQAITGAVGKLRRAIGTVLEKQEPRRGESLTDALAGEAAKGPTDRRPQ